MTIILTDPARELADFLRGLTINQHKKGDIGLAALWDVPVWSSEFFQIIFSISSRIDEVAKLAKLTSLDEDIKNEISDNLDNIRQAFSPNGLQNQWTHSMQNYLNDATIGPLLTLSGLIRPMCSYPKLDEAQTNELVEMASELRTWLSGHQLSEQDFIRAALIEGLDQVIFRLQRVKWLGWGFTAESLKDVITAYMALEREFPNAQANPNAAVVLQRAGAFIKAFYEKTVLVKEGVETGNFVLGLYGAAMAIKHGPTQIAGLLTSLN